MKREKSFSVHYTFSQHFNFSPSSAYKWCTDYQDSDVELMGERGKRKIERINEDTIVLTDTYDSAKGRRTTITKRRLVRLYPERLFWTNTRISREGQHSQFLYEIVPDRHGTSKLIFTGSQIFQDSHMPSKQKILALQKDLTEEDSAAWKLLANEMERDLKAE